MTETRCAWAKLPLDIDYHDKEWGKPLKDEQKLFELFILETMQAGLNWHTILTKRENYRQAFDQFNPAKIANYDEQKYEELLLNEGIIRNKLKIKSVIKNAQAYQKLTETQTFVDYIWSFVNHEPIINEYATISEVPAVTELSEKMSKDMKKKGFSFVGPTTCYAFMQAAGLVNDHTLDCHYR